MIVVVTPIVNKNGKPDIIYKLCIELVITNNMTVLSAHYKAQLDTSNIGRVLILSTSLDKGFGSKNN